ncbi:hypothetical protein [Clostridium sp. N3C]|uniref:hypothetical protein n=1 Tax=Clostridium sp. N3C TaxID=1776758 RepID=UPI000943FB99|nr:hypothetical protein [Clostridium sp. N3C]
MILVKLRMWLKRPCPFYFDENKFSWSWSVRLIVVLYLVIKIGKRKVTMELEFTLHEMVPWEGLEPNAL